MAVTTEKSTQVTSLEASEPTFLQPVDLEGRIRLAFFDFTQGSSAGDANSTATLCRINPGRIRILTRLSWCLWAAFGAGRTLDIGYPANVDIDGATIAASVDTIDDGRDVSSAGSDYLGDGTNALDSILLSTRDPLYVIAKCLGDTLQAAKTLNGWIAYVRD